MKNDNLWQQHLIREAGYIGSPVRRSSCARLLRRVQRHRPPDLLHLPTGIGFLAGFEHVKEKVCLWSAVAAINELESRGLPPRKTPTLVQRLALVGVTSEFASLPSC